METQKTVALVIGAVLTIVGLVGFFVGDNLLGFGINPLHNVVHLLTGAAGLGAALYAAGKFSRDYNKWLGVVYIVVGALGLVVPDLLLTLLNANTADTVLHFGLGIVLAGVGFGVKQ